MAPWPHDLWLTVSHVQMDAAAVPLSPASLVSVLVFNRVGKVSISANPPALNLGAALVGFTQLTGKTSRGTRNAFGTRMPHTTRKLAMPLEHLLERGLSCSAGS